MLETQIVMAWILQCLLWTSVVLSTYSHNYFGFGFPSYFDYPNYDDSPTFPTPNYQRRVDHDHVFHQKHDQFSPHRKEHEMNERSTPKPNERLAQERSIPVNSGLQRIQEQERKRIDPRVDEVSPRNNNGSYKIVNIPKNYSAISNRRGQIQDDVTSTSIDNIVFPGPATKTNKQYIPEVPEECLKNNICEDVPDYPDEIVEGIIEKLDKDKFKIDEMDTPEIAQRIGPPEEMELCEIREKIVVPKAAADKDGKWHYIVNRKDRPLQGVLVELCNPDRAPCSKIVYYGGYEAICKQKFVLRYLTALDENGNMVDKSFKIPSCCSCIVKQIE